MVWCRPLESQDVSDSASLLTRVFLNAPESISGKNAKYRSLNFPLFWISLTMDLAPSTEPFVRKL